MAKKIHEAINIKAGVTDTNVTEIFEEEETEVDTPAEDNKTLLDNEVEEEAPNPEVPAVITAERCSSVASNMNTSTGNMASIANSKAKTKNNLLTSAITASSDATTNAFGALLQQCQMAEEFEWMQCRLEHEEERLRCEEEQARREEELHEMRCKESSQQEQMNQLFQLAMTGLMGY
jgi:hypothetical protein